MSQAQTPYSKPRDPFEAELAQIKADEAAKEEARRASSMQDDALALIQQRVLDQLAEKYGDAPRVSLNPDDPYERRHREPTPQEAAQYYMTRLEQEEAFNSRIMDPNQPMIGPDNRTEAERKADDYRIMLRDAIRRGQKIDPDDYARSFEGQMAQSGMQAIDIAFLGSGAPIKGGIGVYQFLKGLVTKGGKMADDVAAPAINSMLRTRTNPVQRPITGTMNFATNTKRVLGGGVELKAGTTPRLVSELLTFGKHPVTPATLFGLGLLADTEQGQEFTEGLAEKYGAAGELINLARGPAALPGKAVKFGYGSLVDLGAGALQRQVPVTSGLQTVNPLNNTYRGVDGTIRQGQPVPEDPKPITYAPPPREQPVAQNRFTRQDTPGGPRV